MANMTKFNMLYQVAKHLHEALEVYTCARNQDAGLRNRGVEDTIRKAFTTVDLQMDKYRKVKV